MAEAAEIVYGILVYDGVEPIDIGGTYGVLSMGRRVDSRIRMFVVAEKAGPVVLANDLRVIADYGFEDCPPADALIVCGGPGWQRESENPLMLDFLRRWKPDPVIASVCTGALILAASGRLDGHRATTRRCRLAAEPAAPLEIIGKRFPKVEGVEALTVDDGAVVTGGGVSLALDTTLYLIERLHGADVANQIAEAIEYSTAWKANQAAFASLSQ